MRVEIVQNSYTCNLFVTCLVKIVYKVRKEAPVFNKMACEVLLIYCAIARHYQSKNQQIKSDQSLIEKTSKFIRLIMTPAHFCQERIDWLEAEHTPSPKRQARKEEESEKQSISRMPENLIQIRQLKGKAKAFDMSEDEEFTEAQFENKVLVKRSPRTSPASS